LRGRARGCARVEGAPHPPPLCVRTPGIATMWATIVMNWVIATLIIAVVVVWIITQWRIWRSRAVR
jgi:hypothetical protein